MCPWRRHPDFLNWISCRCGAHEQPTYCTHTGWTLGCSLLAEPISGSLSVERACKNHHCDSGNLTQLRSLTLSARLVIFWVWRPLHAQGRRTQLGTRFAWTHRLPSAEPDTACGAASQRRRRHWLVCFKLEECLCGIGRRQLASANGAHSVMALALWAKQMPSRLFAGQTWDAQLKLRQHSWSSYRDRSHTVVASQIKFELDVYSIFLKACMAG